MTLVRAQLSPRQQRPLRRRGRGVAALAWLVSSLLGAWALPARAESPSPPRPLIFVGNQHYPPLIYLQDGVPTGVAVDLASALIAKAGLRADIRGQWWPDAQRDVLDGKADALLLINRSAERDRLYEFSQPLMESEFSIFHRGVRSDLRDVAALAGKQVGVEPGGYSAQLIKRFPQVHPRTIADLAVGVAQLQRGEIDAMVTERWAGEFALAQANATDIAVEEQPIERSKTYIAVRKGNTALLQRIDAGLAALHADGSVDEILQRWRGKRVVYVTAAEFSWYRVAVGLAGLVALLAGVIWIDRRRLARSKQVLAQVAAERQVILTELPIPVAWGRVNLQGRIDYVNAEFVQTFGYALEEIPTQDAWALRAYPDAEYRREVMGWWGSAVADAAARRMPTPQREVSVTRRDGRVLDVLISASVAGDLVIVSLLDITERKLLEAGVRQLAFRDALTNLPNRRLLEEHLDHVMAGCRRSGHYGALLVVDLDNFKPVNDLYGHRAGDQLLVQAARCIQGCLRQCDFVARFGGDEFVVVLSGVEGDRATAAHGASVVAEKLQRALGRVIEVELEPADGQGGGSVGHCVSASIGIALFARDAVTREQLFAKADAAMYQAKAAGRAQHRLHDSGAVAADVVQFDI